MYRGTNISMVISGGALNDNRKRENVKNKLSMRLMVYITLGKEKANEKFVFYFCTELALNLNHVVV